MINEEKGYFVPDAGYKDISYDSIVYDLNRIELLNETINELTSYRDKLDYAAKKDDVVLNFEITRLANKDNFSTDENLQKLALELQKKLLIKRELFTRRNKLLKDQIKDFRKSYYELLNKDVSVNFACLIQQIEKKLNKKIYYSLYLDTVFPSHLNMHKIEKRLKNKSANLHLTISDTKNPEYEKEKNEIFYSKSFPINLEKIKAGGIKLNTYIEPEYNIAEDGTKYTYLKIEDICNTNIDFKLGDLIKESEEWKPVELIKDAVLNYKKEVAEYKKKSQKTKKI